MARSKVVEQRPAGKSGAPLTKLLADCGRCGVPVFTARMGKGRVFVEVLERPTGGVALQAELGSDELTAVEISSPRTWYRLHACKGAFSRVGGGKVRP